MLRYTNRVVREMDGRITIVINQVQLTLTEPAFLAFMEQAIDVLQRIAGSQHKPITGA